MPGASMDEVKRNKIERTLIKYKHVVIFIYHIKVDVTRLWPLGDRRLLWNGDSDVLATLHLLIIRPV